MLPCDCPGSFIFYVAADLHGSIWCGLMTAPPQLGQVSEVGLEAVCTWAACLQLHRSCLSTVTPCVLEILSSRVFMFNSFRRFVPVCLCSRTHTKRPQVESYHHWQASLYNLSTCRDRKSQRMQLLRRKEGASRHNRPLEPAGLSRL
jgi:hypothetical protein